MRSTCASIPVGSAMKDNVPDRGPRRLASESLTGLAHARALRERRREPAERLEEGVPRLVFEAVEGHAEAPPAVATPSAVDDARDRPLDVEPKAKARRVEAHEDLFTRQDALPGADAHPLGRQIQRKIRHQPEIAFTNH